jgi:hypothetical protein
MQIFNPALKQLHRERALSSPDSGDYNYLRSEIASRLMNRLSVIRLPFQNLVILGNDAGGLAEHITTRHINNTLMPYTPKPLKSSFMMSQPPSLEPGVDEAPPTPEELQETMEFFARYSVPELKTVTILDQSHEQLKKTQDGLNSKLSVLPPHSRFETHIFPTALSSIPQFNPGDLVQFAPQPATNLIMATEATTPPPKDVSQSEHSSFATQIIPGRSQLVLSNLNLHWENDLPAVFKSAHQILEPNGAFMGAMIGGETLRELRSSITLAEMERVGGVSNHVSPFAYTKDIGDLLVKAGFEMVSVDVDTLKIPYPDMFTLVSHIQAMGESHAPQDPSTPISKSTWLAANAIYDTLYRDPNGLLTCTVDVIMFVGWKGHHSLNKPAQRGTATAKLGEIVQIPTTHHDVSQSMPSEQEQIRGFFSELKDIDNKQCGKH